MLDFLVKYNKYLPQTGYAKARRMSSLFCEVSINVRSLKIDSTYYHHLNPSTIEKLLQHQNFSKCKLLKDIDLCELKHSQASIIITHFLELKARVKSKVSFTVVNMKLMEQWLT